ncbi:NAD-dependent epimerase/dehydratase family protein, partial [Nitratireductor sp. GCM10026969]|uniref:NAD-dependent epimerase/dehydratase family protein n=1 Tax=Nitratireductor sp. GCM10026969 TaxID=3252645 RepID=UPI00360BA344
MAKVLVTGATGFIGRHLVPVLIRRGHTVVEAGRNRREGTPQFVPVGAIDGETDWSPALAGADAVVHLAGVAHRPDAAEAAYFTVSDVGTGRLVEACAGIGVKAFVFLGSIAAREAADAYGASKRAGEEHVRRFCEGADRAGIVLRPPLVYGFD